VLLALLFGTIFVCGLKNGAWPVTPAAEMEFQRVEADEDAANAEVNQWVKEYRTNKAKRDSPEFHQLQRQVAQRFEPVKGEYEELLAEHPEMAQAHLKFGDFLESREDDNGARLQWKLTLQIDPANGNCFNSLAGSYCESGLVDQAFNLYERAVETIPAEAVYYHNFADCLCVLNEKAAIHYRISEQQVYAKALDLYRKAAMADPQNFLYALDAGQAYYTIRPLPTEDALQTWSNALRSAHNEIEREQVLVHIARVKMLAGRLAEARAQLEFVTRREIAASKINLLRAIKAREERNSADKLPQ
jgi:tetratricopeptide (TPR) repeat protein